MMGRDQYGGNNGMVGFENPYGANSNGISDNTYGVEVDGTTISDSAGSGAMSGAQMGTSIMPGVGTIIGGMIGAIGGAFSGGAKAKRRAREERKRKEAWVKAQQQLARERYNSRVFATKNVQNSYSPANASLGAMYQGANLDLSKTPWSSEYSPEKAAAKSKPAGRTKETARTAKPSKTNDRENSTPPRTKTGTKPQVK
jgi:hypothetical protein